MKEHKIILDRPAHSKIYDGLLRCLKRLTDCKWGYVRGKRIIRYLTSHEIPIKIGIYRGKLYENNCKFVLDIVIDNVPGDLFENTELWENALTAELQVKLLHVVENDRVRALISQWKPYGDYAEMLIESDVQNRHRAINVKSYDVWLDDALSG
jgi:hypothetical protein